jgi:molybdopterin synthase sulfur carrier subunit
VYPRGVTITLLYFAATRDLAGRSEERVALPIDVRTVDELPGFIERHVPALAGHMGQVRLARNEAFAAPGEVLCEGDVVALIPPVAGG